MTYVILNTGRQDPLDREGVRYGDYTFATVQEAMAFVGVSENDEWFFDNYSIVEND